MRRAVVRFGLLVVTIGLLVFLILTQQALQDGLITAFIGGIRNQSAPVLVYSVDGQRTLQGSVIAPPLEQAVRGTAGDRRDRPDRPAHVHGPGQRRPETDAAIVGSSDPTLGTPTTLSAGRRPRAAGEAVGSAVDFSVGDRVTVLASGKGAAPVTITVVGLARDIQLSVTPTLFTDLATYEASVRAANPDAKAVLPNAIGVRPAPGVDAKQLARSIDAASPEADALTRQQAADEAPGVAQVRQSFQVIFLLYALVVPLVTGLFFLIVTLQKANALTLLRAVGARSAVLDAGPALPGGGRHRVGPRRRHRPLRPAVAGQGRVAGAPVRHHGRDRLVGAAHGARSRQRPGVGPPGAAHRPHRSHDRGRRPMRLALRELRRRPGRFAVAAVILTLIAMLLMFLGGLLDGLLGSSTGAYRAQRADLIVYATDAAHLAGAQPHHARPAPPDRGRRRGGRHRWDRERPARRAPR